MVKKYIKIEMVSHDLIKVGEPMSQRALNQEVEQEFSEIADQFIRRYCRVGPGLQIADRTFFPAFRAFWIATAPETQHPALLGQFRVELTERGFQSRGKKRLRWYGITLHQLTVIDEKE